MDCVSYSGSPRHVLLLFVYKDGTEYIIMNGVIVYMHAFSLYCNSVKIATLCSCLSRNSDGELSLLLWQPKSITAVLNDYCNISSCFSVDAITQVEGGGE